MSTYSLKLTIADLPIEFRLDSPTDRNFLTKRYAQYITVNKLKQAPAAVFVVSNNQSAPVRSHHGVYSLKSLAIREKFIGFNDCFRMAFTHLLAIHQGLVLHASSVTDGNKGFVFTGKEGAGKSTIRSLSGKMPLGDDAALIRKINGRFFLYSSPFFQKTNMAYLNRKSPLAGIFNLIQTPYSLVSMLTFDRAMRVCLSNAFIFNHNPTETKKIMLTARDLVSLVPVVDLYFGKNRSFLPLLKTVSQAKLDAQSSLNFINPGVKSLLPDEIEWSSAWATRDFINSCRIISEKSWNFEFGGERKISRVADIIFSDKLNSPHAQYVRQLARRPLNKLATTALVVVRQKNGANTIIDGNHHALALYRRLKGNPKIIIPCIIGKIDHTENCPWL